MYTFKTKIKFEIVVPDLRKQKIKYWIVKCQNWQASMRVILGISHVMLRTWCAWQSATTVCFFPCALKCAIVGLGGKWWTWNISIALFQVTDLHIRTKFANSENWVSWQSKDRYAICQISARNTLHHENTFLNAQ